MKSLILAIWLISCYSFSIFTFDLLGKYQEAFVFLVFTGGPKGSIGKKSVNLGVLSPSKPGKNNESNVFKIFLPFLKMLWRPAKGHLNGRKLFWIRQSPFLSTLHKKWSFPLRISLFFVQWYFLGVFRWVNTNTQELNP